MTVLSIQDMDELIGFGKPASKTADWIVNTYLPNAPVSYRLSIEHAIAAAIIESKHIHHTHAPGEGWVKCSERMPTDGLMVIGWLDGKWAICKRYESGDWYGGKNSASNFRLTWIPIWWHPMLPAPLAAAPSPEGE